MTLQVIFSLGLFLCVSGVEQRYIDKNLVQCMTDLNLTSFVQLLTEAKLDANLKTGGMVLLFGLKIKFKSDILDFLIKSVDNLSDYRYITLMLTNFTKPYEL